jgi:hypothetical protein
MRGASSPRLVRVPRLFEETRPRRRIGRPLTVSVAAHLGLVAWVVTLSVLDVEPVGPPPMPVRFFAGAPPAPRLVPLRDRQEPAPAKTPPPRPAPIPALVVQAPEPVARERMAPERLRPEPLRLAPEPPPIRVADAAPAIAIVDAPPAPDIGRTPTVAPVGALAAPRTGAGEEPELELLVPGKARERSAGGGIAGRDPLPDLPAGEPGGPAIRKGAGAGTGIESEKAFTATGLASFLSRRYGVTLKEASRLGSRSSDGARYALLVPALSEAYRAVPFRGRKRGEAGEGIESVQVDADAIAIRYRDGTLHVVAPTSDGLVALFVSSRPGAAPLSKVQEAERALGALHRLVREGAKGRAG